MITDHELFLLRTIVSAVGDLATKETSGVEKGFLMSFSMTLESLLTTCTDTFVFDHMRSRFEGLPVEGRTGVLYLALLSVCDLVVSFSMSEAEKVSASLFSSSRSMN